MEMPTAANNELKTNVAAINVMKEALYGLIEEDIRTGERILKQIFKNLA